MKFAIVIPMVFFAVLRPEMARASESASDPAAAVETLRAGIAVHPDQAVVLFQDSLQTNPDCRRALLVAALRILGDDPEILTRLIFAARLEFPEDDSLFAEAALSVVPDLASEIRASFLANPERIAAVLAGAPVVDPAVAIASGMEPRSPSPESQKLDEEIRESMARLAAKTSGKPWPEQALSSEPLHFKKADEVRIPRQSRRADETSLYNHLPLDQTDERAIAPGLVKLNDAAEVSSAIRLDESKFAGMDREASTSPLEAVVAERSPAGLVALPKLPPRPRSSVYYIPPPAGSYESTIDRESGEAPLPPLVIRPDATSPSTPR